MTARMQGKVKIQERKWEMEVRIQGKSKKSRRKIRNGS